MDKNELHFWKPNGGFIFLIHHKKRWWFWGTGVVAGNEIKDFAKENNLKLVRIHGPRNLPMTASEIKKKYPQFKR